MKPIEKKPQTVFRIINRKTGFACGSYSRANHDVMDFSSVESAREANCHGIFRDTEEYSIAKYKVTYELIEEDCDVKICKHCELRIETMMDTYHPESNWKEERVTTVIVPDEECENLRCKRGTKEVKDD